MSYYHIAYDIDLGESEIDGTPKYWKPEMNVSPSKFTFSSPKEEKIITLKNLEDKRLFYKIVSNSINYVLSSDTGVIEASSSVSVGFKVSENLRNPSLQLDDEFLMVKTQFLEDFVKATFSGENEATWLDDRCQVSVVAASIRLKPAQAAHPAIGYDTEVCALYPSEETTGNKEFVDLSSNKTGKNDELYTEKGLDSNPTESQPVVDFETEDSINISVQKEAGFHSADQTTDVTVKPTSFIEKMSSVGDFLFKLLHVFLIIYIIYLICMDYMYNPCYGIYAEKPVRKDIDFWAYFVQ